MALKLPWKYKSLIAVVNSYRDGEEDINWARQNNFAVTGSFESFHPLTFFFFFSLHFLPSARGRGSGRVEGRRMVQSAFKFPLSSTIPDFFPFLFFFLFSPNSTAPFLYIFSPHSLSVSLSLSLSLPLSLYSAANPFKASIRGSNQLMFLWCQWLLELLSWHLLIFCSVPSFSL